MDVVFNKSCEKMDELADGVVDMIVTSPPYFSLREYATWDTYKSYLEFVERVAIECFRVVRPGGWVFWNVQDSLPFPPATDNKERYSEPLAADSVRMFLGAGFKYERGVVWYKGQGTATQRLFGTFPRPGLLLISSLTEPILFFRKQKGNYKKEVDKEIIEQSLVTKEEWSKWALDLWEISPTREKGHTAPFPFEIPYRLIRMFSYVGDLILDPFFGSGTTGLAAKLCSRYYVGYEVHKEYVKLAKDRIQVETSLI